MKSRLLVAEAFRLPKLAAMAGALIAALVLLALACGGGDGEAGIRVQKGLGVAALAPGAAETQQGAPATGPVGFGGDASGAAPASIIARGADVGFAPYPFPAPFFQQRQDGITVQGFGSATVAADSAVLELYFGSSPVGIEPLPTPGGTGVEIAPVPPDVRPPGQAQQITEADLQPVIDAVIAQGVPRDDIEVVVGPKYDPYFSNATLRATVRNLDALDAIVQAATDSSTNLGDIQLQSSSVLFTVADCAALERAAMQAAVEDASERGDLFAQALGIGRGPVTGASHYTYSPFGPSPCDPQFGGPYPLGGFPYAQGQPSEVQLIANVTITYAIQ